MFPAVGVSEVDGDIASALQTLSVKFDDTKSPDKTAGTDVEQNPSPVGDTRKVICKEKYLSVKASFSLFSTSMCPCMVCVSSEGWPPEFWCCFYKGEDLQRLSLLTKTSAMCMIIVIFPDVQC